MRTGDKPAEHSLFCGLLQTVLLQNFYNRMQLKSVKKAANEIAENIINDSSFRFIDRAAYENSMQIILTDTNGNIWYRVDECSSAYQTNQNPYRENSRQNACSLHQYPYWRSTVNDSNIADNAAGCHRGAASCWFCPCLFLCQPVCKTCCGYLCTGSKNGRR
ncbi:hypothetical protein AALB53_09390 [Lachnospiraceae bacterium 47-T17]